MLFTVGSICTLDFSLVDQFGNVRMEARRAGLLIYNDGTVCDDYFNDRAADLICQKMGFDYALQHTGYFSEWQQERAITLDDIDCRDTSESIEDCGYDEFEENCSHDEDVLLTCEYRGK